MVASLRSKAGRDLRGRLVTHPSMALGPREQVTRQTKQGTNSPRDGAKSQGSEVHWETLPARGSPRLAVTLGHCQRQAETKAGAWPPTQEGPPLKWALV